MTDIEKKIILAIDLGTTYCCSAVYLNDQITVIPIREEDDDDDDDDKKDNKIPSYVTIFDDKTLIGYESKDQSNIYIGNTVYDVKRFIGKSYNDEELIEDKKYWPFKIIGKSEKPYVQINYKDKSKHYSPEEISALLLKKLKINAEKFLGQEITDAIITVPVYFNNEQRHATKKAGSLAGLNVLRIINEPTAAVMAYGIDKKYDTQKTVLVFDLGGGTFDLSILSINNGFFKVLTSSGDNHLGGIDFDNRLTTYLINEFNKIYINEVKTDITKNNKAKSRLKAKSEHAKELLSIKNEVNIIINSLHEGKDLKIKITRSQFEELNKNLFERIINLVEKALNEIHLDKKQIDEIIMVGGSTKIPKIQEMIKTYFNGIKINNSINPDEAVATGAAIFASTLSGTISEKTQNLVLSDVAPYTLGIKTAYGTVEPIIKRNTPIPAQGIKIFTTSCNKQTTALIPIYEGERLFAKDNNLLGKFYLNNIPQVPKGKLKISIKMEVDENGILNVSATETETGNCNKITITNK